MFHLALLMLPGAAAEAPAARLHVGVPQAAGSVKGLRPDHGESCSYGDSTVSCPHEEQLSALRWSGSDDALTLVHRGPGFFGTPTAFVLAAPGTRPVEEARLARLAEDRSIDRHQLLELRRLVVYTSDWTPPWPTEAALDAHIALLEHPDARVRREALEGLHPWLAGTTYDPLPVSAPVPLDEAALWALTRDPDTGVRRRLARILRDARQAIPRPLVGALLRKLLRDVHPGVRRAAIVALPDAVDRGAFPALDAWEELVQTVRRPRPAGRAACNQLARMKSRLERAQAEVDVRFALESVLRHHPERGWRVWSAWKEELPVERAWMRRLLNDTTGLDRDLVRHWQGTAPDLLEAELADWEPIRHPERRKLVGRMRTDDSLSDPPEAPKPE